MPRVRLLAICAVSLTAVLVAAAPEQSSALATERFVSTTGSDQGAGTVDDPWRTLQHAVDHVGPGDIIRVLPGTYAGMRIENSGSPGNWIKITGGGEAIIDRPGQNNKHGSNVELENWDGDGTVNYWVIRGFEVKNAPNWGIDARGNHANHSHHINIRNNDVHHNGLASTKTGIFFAFVDNVQVVSNDSHHNGEHGVYLSNSGDTFRVRNNRFRQNQRCGLHMNGDLSQGGDGLISDGVVAGNWIKENGSEGCAGINMDGVTDTIVRNNVIVENHGSGIAIFSQDGAQCSRRNKILNNTVVQPDDGRWALVIGGPGCIDNTIRNNVLLTRHSFRGSVEMPTSVVSGLFSNHNIVSDRFTVDDGNSIIDLTEWRAVTSQDADSFVASIDEVFVQGSYRHKPGGVAEDAGATVQAVQDHDFVPRPAPGSAGFDIGAYETPYCNDRRATVVGSRNSESIIGTPGPDVISALKGADAVFGREGNDTICGGKGADILHGQANRDTIFGDFGPDTMLGEKGNDTLDGGPDSDEADGGPGTDNCVAESVARCE